VLNFYKKHIKTFFTTMKSHDAATFNIRPSIRLSHSTCDRGGTGHTRYSWSHHFIQGILCIHMSSTI